MLGSKPPCDIRALTIRDRRRLKIGIPLSVAKPLARTIMPLRVPPLTWLIPYPFNTGQVTMSQEVSICDPAPVEQTFGLKVRGFREELTQYVGQIA